VTEPRKEVTSMIQQPYAKPQLVKLGLLREMTKDYTSKNPDFTYKK
jgi:hypothetical protein